LLLSLSLYFYVSAAIIFRSPDFYHTCYCLSGLSLAQHQISDPDFILGGPTNLLKAIDPEFNLIRGKGDAMRAYFHQ
jgi:protein farnesyltransferase subunit beta